LAAVKGAVVKPHEQARTGRRPVAVVADAKKRLFVVNNLSDSLSIVDPQIDRNSWQELALGPTPTPGPRERGELMFYGAREAFHWWASCHSCHTDGHTCGQLADTFGDNTYGTPKRVLTLLGTGLSDPWAWSGAERELRDQLHKSLETTSYNRLGYAKDPEATAHRLEDLAAFLQTLPPPPPLEPATSDPNDAQQIERGRKIFHNRDCARCHVPPLTYTSPDAYDVGLADGLGQKKFNPPSLCGAGQGESFLHDGRAKSLSDVFVEFSHGLDSSLSDRELADLLRFLRSI
jgi:cytochrome c553